MHRYETVGSAEKGDRCVHILDFFVVVFFFHLNLITLCSLYMTHYCLAPLGYKGIFTYMGVLVSKNAPTTGYVIRNGAFRKHVINSKFSVSLRGTWKAEATWEPLQNGCRTRPVLC